jgi:hypothetical protein
VRDWQTKLFEACFLIGRTYPCADADWLACYALHLPERKAKDEEKKGEGR